MIGTAARAHVVVVGGSVAAVTAADALRAAGHDGPITILSDEHRAPYVRPPLSKAVLTGAAEPDSVLMPALGNDVTLRTGARAAGLDPDRRRVLLVGGEQVPYDGLLIATGARARRLSDNPRERVLRTLDDTMALRADLLRARSVLIVGGGFLGMEIASSAAKLGVDVTVVDQDPHLQRQFGPELAAYLCGLARAAGVTLARADGGVELLGPGEITAVRTGAGDVLEADLVISAVGCRPNVEWLLESAIGTAAGVLTDDRGLVRPEIAAAGDVVVGRHESGQLRRTPHWSAALDQSRVAATALIRGAEAPAYAPRPFFWTEQFGAEVKVAGEIAPQAKSTELEGSLLDANALLQWTVDDQPVAAAVVNRKLPIGKLHALARPARQSPAPASPQPARSGGL